MNRIYLLCGASFSGKSTLAAAIAARTGAAVVSLDAINARRGLDGGQGVPAEEWQKSHALALEEIAALARTAVPRIVVDDTLCFRFLRDDYRAAVARLGYEHVLVLVDAPLGLLLARRRENARSANRNEIVDKVFESCYRCFEWPQTDEPHLVYAAGSDLEGFLARAEARWPAR